MGPTVNIMGCRLECITHRWRFVVFAGTYPSFFLYPDPPTHLPTHTDEKQRFWVSFFLDFCQKNRACGAKINVFFAFLEFFCAPSARDLEKVFSELLDFRSGWVSERSGSKHRGMKVLAISFH